MPKWTAGGICAKRRLPGEPGLWLVVGGDMVVFALFFGYFIHDLGVYPSVFHCGQARLNQTLAAINTIILLSSSWFVASAVAAAREKKRYLDTVCLVAAFVCGVAFCAIKFFEYREKILHGITLNTNEFWTLYYMFTGIHCAHVIIGLGVLAFLMNVSRKDSFDPDKRVAFLEIGGGYWHMVDLLWIGLFALLYLVK